jgi:hypothetical protein
MAAGIGLRVDQVIEIEEGTAPDALRNLYAQWLIASKDSPQTSTSRGCWPPKKVTSASGHDANCGESYDEGDRHGEDHQSVLR